MEAIARRVSLEVAASVRVRDPARVGETARVRESTLVHGAVQRDEAGPG